MIYDIIWGKSFGDCNLPHIFSMTMIWLFHAPRIFIFVFIFRRKISQFVVVLDWFFRVKNSQRLVENVTMWLIRPEKRVKMRQSRQDGFESKQKKLTDFRTSGKEFRDATCMLWDAPSCVDFFSLFLTRTQSDGFSISIYNAWAKDMPEARRAEWWKCDSRKIFKLLFGLARKSGRKSSLKALEGGRNIEVVSCYFWFSSLSLKIIWS